MPTGVWWQRKFTCGKYDFNLLDLYCLTSTLAQVLAHNHNLKKIFILSIHETKKLNPHVQCVCYLFSIKSISFYYQTTASSSTLMTLTLFKRAFLHEILRNVSLFGLLIFAKEEFMGIQYTRKLTLKCLLQCTFLIYIVVLTCP